MFLQPDWFEVTAAGVGTNRYAYAGGDPVNGSDPGGNCWIQGPVPAASSCGGSFWHQVGTPFLNFPANVANAVLSPVTVAGELLAPYDQDLTNFALTTPVPADDALSLAVRGIVWTKNVSVANLARLSASSRLTGEVVDVNESMSLAARAYQSRVAGLPPGKAYLQNGVRFDGVDEATGTLIDAKSGMDFMVQGNPGTFNSWSRFRFDAVGQARAQISASNGAQIEWRFQSQRVAQATQEVFDEADITGIRIVHFP